MSIVSPIALDMGAKYTGVYTLQYPAGLDLESADKDSVVVMHTDHITYSQIGRTQNRHQTRAADRRKLAKRMLKLVLRHCYQIDFDLLLQAQKEAINSLLNRRGFTYLAEEVDEATLINLPTGLFVNYLPLLPAQDNLFDAYLLITESLETTQEFLSQDALLLSDKELVKLIPEDHQEHKQIIKKGLKELKQGLIYFVKSEREGHKHRKLYLENIKSDILYHKDYAFLREKVTDKVGFSNLVGHVSNLQLRVLRRYFNDKNMKSGDLWLPEKLHKVFFRNVTGMHYKPKNKELQKVLLKHRELPIIEMFQKLNPELSIPPFEDQNNRRPPKCQSLLIDSSVMLKMLPLWWSVIPPLADKIEGFGIPVLGGQLLDKDDPDSAALCLQRMLELSYAHDPFQFRRWIKNPEKAGHKCTSSIQLFEQIVPKQHQPAFISLAQQFYKETSDARSALWFPMKDSIQLLKVCNGKTPHKANQLSELLSDVFNHALQEDQFNTFLRLWKENPKIKGNTRLKGMCLKAAEIQKDEGNALNELLRRNQWLIKQERKPENKTLITLNDQTQVAASLIANTVGIDSKRFSNLFDMAKLYNLLENDPKGFSKNCRRCTTENAWRGRIKENTEGKTAAYGLRLPADTTRPFDGYLARMLDRQAYEIAKIKSKQLKELENESSISIPILLEENQFRFTLALKEIKRSISTSDKTKLNKKIESKESEWLNKNDRIKLASQNICPYSGQALLKSGEIDHIVSRTESQGRNQGVFNHEANLIYCSTSGNTQKLDVTYYLEDLHDNYLQIQFGTTDRHEIEADLIKKCAPFIEKGELISFTELEPNQQKALRHGLFTAELRPQLIRLLNQSTKTKVNGTQAFFAKCLMQKIQQLNPKKNIQFQVHYIDPQLASALRQQLADHDDCYEKKQPQPVSSHMIDAVMVMAAGSQQPHSAHSLQTLGRDSPDWLKSLIPNSMSILRIERKPKYKKSTIASQPIFKEGLYAEHFVPVILIKSKLGFGFDDQNVIWVNDDETANSYWELLMPFTKVQKPLYESTPKTGFTAFPIDKDKAFSLLHKVAKQATTDQEKVTAQLLRGIRYSSKKKSLKEALYNKDNKSYQPLDSILNESKDFTIILNLKKTDGKKITYPAKAEWLNVLARPEVKKMAGQKAAFDEEAYLSLVTALFPDTIKNDRHHKKVRKVWSLPKIAKISGGYRAKRRNPEGDTIWQLFEVDSLSSQGFKQVDGIIDFDKNASIPIEAIAKSPKLSALNETWSDEKSETVFFNSFRRVKIVEELSNKIVGLGFYPNSKERFRVRVRFTEQAFSRYVKPLLKDTNHEISTWLDIPAELKLDDPKQWKEAFLDKIGQPRSNLFICSIGAFIDIEYIADGTNKEMKASYQDGIPT